VFAVRTPSDDRQFIGTLDGPKVEGKPACRYDCNDFMMGGSMATILELALKMQRGEAPSCVFILRGV
jgi:hypothetical protein